MYIKGEKINGNMFGEKKKRLNRLDSAFYKIIASCQKKIENMQKENRILNNNLSLKKKRGN